jgi:hypothetical protein
MEMFVDYRKDINNYKSLSIKNQNVTVVEKYKYLGVYIDNHLAFADNVNHIYKKAVQRTHYLRILNDAKVGKQIMTLFYKSTIESVLSFCVTSWYGLARKKDLVKLAKIIRRARKMGLQVCNVEKLHNENMLRVTSVIMKDTKHPLNQYYTFLRSGTRLRAIAHKTTRLGNSFVPSSIKLYNYKFARRT